MISYSCRLHARLDKDLPITVDLGVCFQALKDFLSFSDTFIQFANPAHFIRSPTWPVYASTEIAVDLAPVSFSLNDNGMSGGLTSSDRRMKVEPHKEGERTRLCIQAHCMELVIHSRNESLLSAKVSKFDFNHRAGSSELFIHVVIANFSELFFSRLASVKLPVMKNRPNTTNIRESLMKHSELLEYFSTLLSSYQIEQFRCSLIFPGDQRITVSMSGTMVNTKGNESKTQGQFW
jgi:hypothetical protein